jgi:hypothetical protein
MTGGVTIDHAAPRATFRSTREQLARVARAIEPVLNRVVLAGPPVIELLIADRGARSRLISFAADSTLHLLTTSMIDRIGLDLQKLGLSRIGRTASTDRWQVSVDVTFELIQVDADGAQPWLEYATLLTMPHVIDAPLAARIAGAPAMLALECSSFDTTGGRAAESAALERAIQLVAGRPEIEREVAAAPAELRSFIAATLGPVARSDALQLLIARTLPDAALLPEFARRVTDRLRRISAAC